MSTKNRITKPLVAAIGVAFVTSLAVSTTAIAADNPFSATDLDQGYLLAGDNEPEEGKCGEGKCGEGKCGGEDHTPEGHCGAAKGEEGSCGEHSGEEKGEEGSCGEKEG